MYKHNILLGGGDVYKQTFYLREGAFINKYFTWGGDGYKQIFYLGRGRL